MGVTATKDSTFEWREIGGQVRIYQFSWKISRMGHYNLQSKSRIKDKSSISATH
jgi:hypothetical protein